MLNGFTHVWVANKHPFFLSDGGRYIIILEIDSLLPIWYPQMENSRELLGTFEFWENIFKERCGVYINPSFEICLDTKLYRPFKRPLPEVSSPRGRPSKSVVAVNVEPDPIGEPKVLAPPTPDMDEVEEMARTREPVVREDEELSEIPPDIFGEGYPIEEEEWNKDDHEIFDKEILRCDDNEEDVPPPPAPMIGPLDHRPVRITQRQKARSKMHLMSHNEFVEDCVGCQAKARNKKHFKGAFDRSDERHEHTVTMDQVSLTDVDGTLGIGNYRYA